MNPGTTKCDGYTPVSRIKRRLSMFSHLGSKSGMMYKTYIPFGLALGDDVGFGVG